MGGKTYWWCPHHKHPQGFWDGLYVRHHPDNHKFRKPRESGNDDKDTTPAANSTKLDLQSKLKEVLSTNLCMSSEDIDRLFEEAASN